MRHHTILSITSAVITSTLLLTSASAYTKQHYKDYYKDAVVTAPCHQPLYLNDGFYVGGQVGYDAYRVRATNSFTSPAVAALGLPSGFFSAAANPVISANGFVGGLFAGYGQYWGDFFYTGFEIFANGSNAGQTQNFSATFAGTGGVSNATQVNSDISYGATVLPGLKVNPSTLFYGRVGYTEARLRGQSAITVNATGKGNFSLLANDKQWTGGIHYGLGIETAVFPQVSVRSEYIHTDYHSFSDPNLTQYSQSDNQLLVSLIYHFV